MPDIIDLDRIKKLAILGIFSNGFLRQRLVLKGGNLLDVVYHVSTRSSTDIDFSMADEFDEPQQAQQHFEQALSETFIQAGFVVFDVRVEEKPDNLSKDLSAFWGGYQASFKIIEQERYNKYSPDIARLRRNAIAVGASGSTKFHIDISKHEFCEEKDAADLDGHQIYVYTPEMVVAEKLRAICQQMPEYTQMVHKHLAGRARDFVDIHTTAEEFLINFSKPSFHRTVKSTFAAKRVPLRLIGQIWEYAEDHSGDFVAIRSTVKAHVKLQAFDFYVDYVVGKCEALKPLWNK